MHPERALQNLTEGSLGLVFSQSVLLALVSARPDPRRGLPDRPARRPAGLVGAAPAARRPRGRPGGHAATGRARRGLRPDPHAAPRRPVRRRPRGAVTSVGAGAVELPQVHSGKVRELYDAGDGPPAHGGLGPGQRVRRDHGRADPRQGPGAHRHDHLLVRGDGRRRPGHPAGGGPGRHRRRAGRHGAPARVGGPGRPGAPGRHAATSSASCGATWPGRPGRSTSGRARCTARPCRRACSWPAGWPSPCSPRRPRRRRATTSTSTSPRPSTWWGSRRPRRPATSASSSTAGPPRGRPPPASSWPTPSSSSAGSTACSACATRCARPTPRGCGRPTRSCRAPRRRPSTSSRCATGWPRSPGTARRPRPRCPTRSSAAMSARYVAAYERVTGRSLGDWYGATSA